MQQPDPQPGSEAAFDSFVDVLGIRMHYLHAGVGRPIVLIHGLVGSSANWRRNIDALAGHASVYAIDLVNMGKSQSVAGIDVSLEATADRVAAMITALGLADADIAGHSHGGGVALMFAARHPQLVRSLILFAPANPFSHVGDDLVRVYSTPLGRLVAESAPYLPAPVQRIGLERMYGDPARIADGCLRSYIDGLRVPGAMRHVLDIVRCWFADMAKLNAALPRVAAVPTLLVWGDRDRAVSLASGRRLNLELTSSELIVVPTGGHVLFEELPEESNRIMLEWLRRHPVSGPALTPRDAEHGKPTQRPRPRRASIAASETSAALRRLSPET